MGNLPDLPNHCLIDLPFSMAVDIDPKGGDSVKIPSSLNVFEIGTLTRLNDKRLNPSVILHLGEMGPEQGLVDLLQMPMKRFLFHHPLTPYLPPGSQGKANAKWQIIE